MKLLWQLLICFIIILVFLGTLKNAKFYKIPDFLTKYWAFQAITLPPIGIFLGSTAYNESTVKHELVHWEQWKRYGTLGFYIRYLSGWIKNGYRNNPMEIEAYENEA